MQFHTVGKVETVAGIVGIVGITLYGIEASVGVWKLFDTIRPVFIHGITGRTACGIGFGFGTGRPQ